MALQISISNAIGARAVAGGGGIDPDAQAFITASGITDATQQSAINQLVVDLKGYGIWTKMKALYPFVGGTASTHKFNLKDPRDLDVAFRLVFNGGWTHSVNGALPNGTNAYADTKLFPFSTLTNNTHLAYYSRTNVNATTTTCDIGVASGPSGPDYLFLFPRLNDVTWYTILESGSYTTASDTNSAAFYTGTRTGTTVKGFKNGTNVAIRTGIAVQPKTNAPIYLGAINLSSTVGASWFSSRQCAFASIGDDLTDTEAANFYTAVQTFQTTLGRSIGTQTVSDADAQAFVTNAGIVDQVEANAVNNLVIGLKADSLWTKMKAIYPFVGGTATTHKYNLKNPLDTDAAFRLVFNGGWTHSSTGSTPNGSNGYADTKLATTGNIAQNSASMGVYSRNNTATTGAHGIRPASITGLFELFERYTDNNFYCYLNDSGGFFGTSVLDSRGFNQGSRTASNVIRYNRNTTTNTGITNSNATSTLNAYIGASNTGTGATFYNNREIAFFYIGDGLTNTEMQNYYTRVQTFQTALNRNV